MGVVGCSPGLKAREIFKDKKVRSLAIAAEEGSTNKIDQILAEGVDVNSVGDEGVTPLAWALLKMNKVGFEHLLKRGADPKPAEPEPKFLPAGKLILRQAEFPSAPV